MAAMDLGPFPEDPLFATAAELDAAEPLSEWRERFSVADDELIYLDGNSLGRLPNAAAVAVDDAVQRQWGHRLIRSWNEGWWDLQIDIGETIAEVVGASSGEVIVSDSTTVNLYKLAVAAMTARPNRQKIVTDDLNFPSDLYVLESAARHAGPNGRVEIVESPDGVLGPVEKLLRAIDDDTALVSLSATTFKSGYTYDLTEVTAAAHERGALVLWDLSHSAGVVDQGLNAANVDLAVGCTYKHLNGGPGSPAFLYVRRDLQPLLHNPIQGWFAHEDPFAFDLGFRATDGPRRFHVGTMPMLSLVGAQAGVEMVAEATVAATQRAARSLVAWAEELFDALLAPLGFEFASPRDPERRGAHISVAHDDAWRITQSLIADAQVLPDFRAPRFLRLGFAPLYTTHVEIHTAMRRLVGLMESGLHQRYAAEIDGIT